MRIHVTQAVGMFQKSGMKYQPGDSISVICANHDREVSQLITRWADAWWLLVVNHGYGDGEGVDDGVNRWSWYTYCSILWILVIICVENVPSDPWVRVWICFLFIVVYGFNLKRKDFFLNSVHLKNVYPAFNTIFLETFTYIYFLVNEPVTIFFKRSPLVVSCTCTHHQVQPLL